MGCLTSCTTHSLTRLQPTNCYTRACQRERERGFITSSTVCCCCRCAHLWASRQPKSLHVAASTSHTLSLSLSLFHTLSFFRALYLVNFVVFCLHVSLSRSVASALAIPPSCSLSPFQPITCSSSTPRLVLVVRVGLFSRNVKVPLRFFLTQTVSTPTEWSLCDGAAVLWWYDVMPALTLALRSRSREKTSRPMT